MKSFGRIWLKTNPMAESCKQSNCEFRLLETRIIFWLFDRPVGCYSTIGVTTRHGLEGPGIGYRWELDIRHTSIPAIGSTEPPVEWVPGHFPGGEAAGAWSWSPIPILHRRWRKNGAIRVLLLLLRALMACSRMTLCRYDQVVGCRNVAACRWSDVVMPVRGGGPMS
jgi:membrane-associated phospholipid phosphatase